MASSNTNPHIRPRHSPLQTLIMQALRRYGEFHPGTVDGDVSLMFLEFANLVIDDIRMHPYAPDADLSYYESIADVRPINDQIIVAGLLYHYAFQQGSDKLQLYMPAYYKTMNQLLWQDFNGNTKIQMRVPDDGTNPKNSTGIKTSTTNGLPQPDTGSD